MAQRKTKVKAKGVWEANAEQAGAGVLATLKTILALLQRYQPAVDAQSGRDERWQVAADERQERAEQRASARMREDTAAKLLAACVLRSPGALLRDAVDDDDVMQAVVVADMLRKTLAEVADPLFAEPLLREVTSASQADVDRAKAILLKNPAVAEVSQP